MSQANAPVDSSVRVITVDRQCGQVHCTGFLPNVVIGTTCTPNAGGTGGTGFVYFISFSCSCGGTAYAAALDPIGGRGADLSITSSREQEKKDSNDHE